MSANETSQATKPEERIPEKPPQEAPLSDEEVRQILQRLSEIHYPESKDYAIVRWTNNNGHVQIPLAQIERTIVLNPGERITIATVTPGQPRTVEDDAYLERVQKEMEAAGVVERTLEAET